MKPFISWNSCRACLLLAAILCSLSATAQECPRSFEPLNPSDFRSPKLHEPAKNLILLIGDGMGPVQVEAAGNPFAAFPYRGEMTHCSLSGVTDSAAAATTMATGEKTLNGKIGVDAKDQPLITILEIAAKAGKSTGLITTTEITHATPACFAAHVAGREEAVAIAKDYLQKTQPNFLAGGGAKYFEGLSTSPYTLARDLPALRQAPVETNLHLLALLAPGHLDWASERLAHKEVSLLELTQEAVRRLEKNPKGFFLMVEGGRIDHACHENNLARMIPEVREFAQTADWLQSWATKDRHTLVLLTADHETGGLHREGKTFAFSTKRHTAAPVPLWGMGPNADVIRATQDNRAVFHILHEAMRNPTIVKR